MDLAGKIAIVTGGTGALGAAVVHVFLEAGAKVAVPYHRADGWNKLRDSESAAGTSLVGAEVDSTNETAVAAFYTQVAEEAGGIDILINVAGGFGGGHPVHETDWSLWEQQFSVNLKTTVLSCKAAIPHMIGRSGAIINVSSRTATQAGAKVAAYAASKRAVLQLTETLAAELKGDDITVNSILPSTIDTPTNRSANPKGKIDTWVAPQEIARVILFLAGPDARIISGAHIPVYGKA